MYSAYERAKNTAVGILTTAVILLILLPIGIIWALNQVFGLGIEYSFLNWLAVSFLLLVGKVQFNARK